MGWEWRHGGRWYLYWNRRVGGRPVKEYVGCEDHYGSGAASAHTLAEIQGRAGTLRKLVRVARTAYRGRVSGIVAAAEAANDVLRTIAEGVLCAAGFHRHNRGEWRMRRHVRTLAEQLVRVKEALAEAGPRPLIRPSSR